MLPDKMPLQKTKIINMSWYNFDFAVSYLASEISQSGEKFNCIYGVPRGGLVLGVCLSHKLNIPLYFDWHESSIKTLIVDDTSDTGKTLSYIHDCFPETKISTIYYNKKSKVKPDFYVWEQKPEEWINFPWEKKIK
jgi:xanthine phosphoribosyltransferase